MMTTGQQHVTPCVKGVELRLGTKGDVKIVTTATI